MSNFLSLKTKQKRHMRVRGFTNCEKLKRQWKGK